MNSLDTFFLEINQRNIDECVPACGLLSNGDPDQNCFNPTLLPTEQEELLKRIFQYMSIPQAPDFKLDNNPWRISIKNNGYNLTCFPPQWIPNLAVRCEGYARPDFSAETTPDYRFILNITGEYVEMLSKDCLVTGCRYKNYTTIRNNPELFLIQKYINKSPLQLYSRTQCNQHAINAFVVAIFACICISSITPITMRELKCLLFINYPADVKAQTIDKIYKNIVVLLGSMALIGFALFFMREYNKHYQTDEGYIYNDLIPTPGVYLIQETLYKIIHYPL